MAGNAAMDAYCRWVDDNTAEALHVNPVKTFAAGYEAGERDQRMTFDEYQEFSMARAGATRTEREQLTLAALGMAGEAGEVADLVKKALYHGQELDRDKLILEAGDVLWYVAYLADALGVPLFRIAEANREKLLRRYPNGFSEQDAAAR